MPNLGSLADLTGLINHRGRVSKVFDTRFLDFNGYASLRQRVPTGLKNLENTEGALSVSPRRPSGQDAIKEVLTFRAQRFLVGNWNHLTAVLCCDGLAVEPVDAMRVQHQLVFGLNIVEYSHFLASNDGKFLFLERM